MQVGGVSVFSAGLYLPGQREHCHGFGRQEDGIEDGEGGLGLRGSGACVPNVLS